MDIKYKILIFRGWDNGCYNSPLVITPANKKEFFEFLKKSSEETRMGILKVKTDPDNPKYILAFCKKDPEFKQLFDDIRLGILKIENLSPQQYDFDCLVTARIALLDTNKIVVYTQPDYPKTVTKPMMEHIVKPGLAQLENTNVCLLYATNKKDVGEHFKQSPRPKGKGKTQLCL